MGGIRQDSSAVDLARSTKILSKHSLSHLFFRAAECDLGFSSLRSVRALMSALKMWSSGGSADGRPRGPHRLHCADDRTLHRKIRCRPCRMGFANSPRSQSLKDQMPIGLLLSVNRDAPNIDLEVKENTRPGLPVGPKKESSIQNRPEKSGRAFRHGALRPLHQRSTLHAG